MEDCASLDYWEERLKERYPMLRYFTTRSFGVEIEFFGLKYSVSAGDQDIIPPYKIMNRTPEGILMPRVFQERGMVLNGYLPPRLLTKPGPLCWTTPSRGPGGLNW